MKTLPLELGYQDRKLKQLKRQGRIAIYEVFGPGKFLLGYEVIIIKFAPAKELFGCCVPEREVYPSSAKNSNDWGHIAWTYNRKDLELALKRYQGLCEEEREGTLKVVRRPDVSDLNSG